MEHQAVVRTCFSADISLGMSQGGIWCSMLLQTRPELEAILVDQRHGESWTGVQWRDRGHKSSKRKVPHESYAQKYRAGNDLQIYPACEGLLGPGAVESRVTLQGSHMSNSDGERGVTCL